MKTKTNLFYLILLGVLLCMPWAASAQVTIGDDVAPKATLDVVGQAGNPDVADGVIAPRLKLAQLQDKNNAYKAEHNGVIVYVTDAIGTPAGKTINVTAAGYYYYDQAAGVSDADGVWKGFGGAAAPNVIVTTLNANSFPASYFSAQHTVIVHYGAATTTLTLPDLTAAECGKLLTISNRGTNGTIQANCSQIDQDTGTPVISSLPASILINRTRTYMWIGNAWMEWGL